MQVDISGRHFHVSDGLRDHALAKIPKLEKYSLKIETAHIIFQVQKRTHICEIILAGKELRLTAVEKTGDIYASFDAALTNIQNQLARFHEKLKSHRQKKIEETE
jgi:ribosomal subunit interface protein